MYAKASWLKNINCFSNSEKLVHFLSAESMCNCILASFYSAFKKYYSTNCLPFWNNISCKLKWISAPFQKQILLLGYTSQKLWFSIICRRYRMKEKFWNRNCVSYYIFIFVTIPATRCWFWSRLQIWFNLLSVIYSTFTAKYFFLGSICKTLIYRLHSLL